MSRNAKPGKRAAAASVRNLNYATSPLLASKTPPWRSRFLVALVGLAFAVLIGRAVYIQIIGTDFYQQQGDKRYGHVIEVPASRGRILDRNGQVLATSVPVPSIWAIPKDFTADVQQRNALARLLSMKPLELDQKLEGSRNFAWLKRQVDEPLWAQIRLNVGAFMNDLFRQGAFQGRTPREAYFVKCDKETTTQNDINLGIVNVVIGFAPLKPAELVIIKLQQMAGQIDV